MSKGLSKEDTKQEHPLQAVILCDAWGEEARWGPLVRRSRTEEEEDEGVELGGETRPWCLLPLLNTPLLAWTLECLSASNVEQVFIFVRDGVDEVRAWLATSSFQGPATTLSIVIRPTTAMTPGDVMREVDSLQILAPADFLVVQAGYVGNVDLGAKVKEFTERRLAKPTLSMSCVVAPRKNATTSKFAVHVFSADDQLYHYEESTLFPRLKCVQVSRDALGPKDVSVRADLESVGVAICSTEVPPLFTENFDYQFFYPDFVNGILTSDLLGKTICCTIIGEGSQRPEGSRRSTSWAGVVGNTRSYDAVSKAILSRRAYPLAPDENVPDGSDRYEQRRARVYYGKNLDLARTCTISSTSLLGRDLIIGPDTSVTHTIISPTVSIGSGCEISGCYIFEGAVVGDDCIVRNSIIGEGARVGAGSVVDCGSLIGAGVVLGTKAVLSGKNVSREAPEDEDAENADGSLGEGEHVAFFWPSSEGIVAGDDSDSEDEVDPRNYGLTRIGAQLDTLHITSSSSSLSSLSRSSSTTSLSTTASASTHYGESSISGLASLVPVSTQSDFASECTLSLDRSFAEDHTVDNAAIELKTLRMASNVPLGQVRDVVISFILARCETTASVPAIIKRWGGLVGSLTGNQEEAMADSILTVQRVVAESGKETNFFLRVLKGFYEQDVVSEEAVFGWYKSAAARMTGGEAGRELWSGSKPFVQFLMESSSDEEDSD